MGNYELIDMDECKAMLESIKTIYGIEAIKEFIKESDKANRKSATRVNNFFDVYSDVQGLMNGRQDAFSFVGGYSYTRAVLEVAQRRSISEKTVKTHYTKGKKEAERREKEKVRKESDEFINNIREEDIPF